MKFLGSIGPVLVYEKPFRVGGFVIGWSSPTYFWRYYDKAAVYGPFTTPEETERHIQGCLVASGRQNESVPDNTVRVDFKAKKRIV